MVVLYRRFGTTYRSYLQWPSSPAWPLKRGPIGYSETSVRNHPSAARRITKERRSNWMLSLNATEFVTINFLPS
jgi:hypothetical protein